MHYRSLAKCLFSLLSLCLLLYSVCASAFNPNHSLHHRRFYAGMTIGYGRTTWNELVSDDEVVLASTPKDTRDFGTTWGGFIGYQFSQSFALEATYTRYPNTDILLADYSFYDPLTEFTTRTQAYSAIAKFILPLANSRLNAFLDAGMAFTHRSDCLAKVTRVAPTFGLGLATNISSRLIGELGFEYYIGYGKSERNPVKDFVPFLFGVYFRVGYRFG